MIGGPRSGMFDLTGKAAIITGSTRGIGKAIALALARAGASVAISSRTAEASESVADEFRTEGLSAVALPCHVDHADQLEALVQGTVAAFGRLDILVCNAATNPIHGPMQDVPDNVFDKIIGTNLKSVFQLSKLAGPRLSDDGSIIVVSSIAGIRGNAEIGVYGISKAAEAALVRNLAVEWGPRGIRANAIAPGLIRTDFSKRLTEDPRRLERVTTRTPLRRIGEPDDIAGVAVFLASKAAAFITGQTIVADGGETIS